MSKVDDYKNLWVEKYRPDGLDSLVLEDYIRADMEKYASSGEIPHLLFYGQAGGGKTTLAKVLVNNLLDCEYLYINGSDESGVDVVRGKIKAFAERKGFISDKKVIILDECDGLSSSGGGGTSAQQALRNIMEEYAHNVRFILTANYFNKITDPIVSRCIVYQISPPIKDFILRCFDILKTENISVGRGEFVPYIKSFYPDMRKAINAMQRDSIDGALVIRDHVEIAVGISTDIIKHIITKKSSISLRQMILDRSSEFNNDYRLLLSGIFDEVYKFKMDDDTKRLFMIELSDGMYRHESVMDKEINAYSTLLRLY
jgi:replication factor C small subunit